MGRFVNPNNSAFSNEEIRFEFAMGRRSIIAA